MQMRKPSFCCSAGSSNWSLRLPGSDGQGGCQNNQARRVADGSLHLNK